MDLDIVIELCGIFDKKIENADDLQNIEFTMEELRNTENINNLKSLTDKIKLKYKSNMLNCLHSNSLDKQKFPGINYLRQILKCNNIKLKGRYISMGYCKNSGKKSEFFIEPGDQNIL